MFITLSLIRALLLKYHLFLFLGLFLALAGCAQPAGAPSVSADSTGSAPPPDASHTATATRLATSALSQEDGFRAEPQAEDPQPESTASPLPSPAGSTPPPMTPWPTATPSPAAPLPTLPPATPAPAAEYQLREWTAEEADGLIARLEQFPETLPAEERSYGDGAYYAAFRYAALAQEEALNRFPEAAAAERWRWALAYNYVRIGDGRAIETYAGLIEQALQSAVVTPEALPSWFAAREPRLTVAQRQLDAPSGFLSAYLLEMRAGESGTFFWLLYDGQNYHVYSLGDARDLDLAYGVRLSYDLTDITGDGNPDLVAVHGHQPGDHPSFYYTDLTLYDLSQTPPRRLTLQPSPSTHLGWGERDGWTVVISANGATQFRLRGLVSWQCDAVEQVSNYVWRDGGFYLGDVRYQIQNDGNGGSRFCLPFIYSAAEQGNEDALSYLATTAESALANGRPEADEYRLRLAVYWALSGDFQVAAQHLASLISQPVDAVGSWLPAAIRFRDAYESPEDLYRACAAEELCDERLALQRLVSRLAATDFGVLTDHLQAWGVPLNRYSFVDLDGDGQLEQWVLVNRPNAEMAVWLFWRGPEGIQALYVDTLARDDQTFTLERLTPVEGRALLRLRSGFEERLLAIDRDSAGTVSLTQLRADSDNENQNFTRQLLAESQAALLGSRAVLLGSQNDVLNGPAPNETADGRQSALELLERLLTFRDSGAFDCRSAVRETLCADYAYTVALAYEMAGDEAGAVQAYRQLWRDYPDSPLALIARSKLAPASRADGAQTATITPDP
ncbi:MAG: tetratricopeptide repeat protein [Chloroflexota bacterium]